MGLVATDFGIKNALDQLNVKDINEGTSTGSDFFASGELIDSYSPVDGTLIAKVKTGDMIMLDGETGELTLQVDEQELAARDNAIFQVNGHHQGMGRELFGFMRRNLSSAETGACSLFDE